MYQDHFLGAEAALRQHERTNDIIGHNSAGVANDVSIAMGKPEHLENVHTTVHTSDNRQVSLGGEGKSVIGKILGKTLIVPEQVIRIWCEFFGCYHADIVSYREVVSAYDF
jgi:hypothetical protein